MVEAPLLLAVQRIIAGIEIDSHFLGMLGQTAHSQTKQGGFDLFRLSVNLVAADIFVIAQFQPVESGRTCQCLALILLCAIHAQRVALSSRHREERIEAQAVVIIEIFVSRRQAQQALREQFAHGVFGKAGVAAIAKTSSQGAGDAQTLVDLAQVSAREVCLHAARAEIRHMNSSKRGTVKAVSPWFGLQIMPLAIN